MKLPKGVKTIANDAFESKLNVTNTDSATYDLEIITPEYAQKELLPKNVEKVIIPKGVREIGDNAFKNKYVVEVVV